MRSNCESLLPYTNVLHLPRVGLTVVTRCCCVVVVAVVANNCSALVVLCASNVAFNLYLCRVSGTSGTSAVAAGSNVAEADSDVDDVEPDSSVATDESYSGASESESSPAEDSRSDRATDSQGSPSAASRYPWERRSRSLPHTNRLGFRRRLRRHGVQSRLRELADRRMSAVRTAPRQQTRRVYLRR